MKRRPYMDVLWPRHSPVTEPQKQRLGSRVFWKEVDVTEPQMDLNPFLHTVEIDMANGTLLPVETHLLTPSTAQINDMLNHFENTFENEDQNLKNSQE